jgi:hypothetical protein
VPGRIFVCSRQCCMIVYGYGAERGYAGGNDAAAAPHAAQTYCVEWRGSPHGKLLMHCCKKHQDVSQETRDTRDPVP